MRRRLVVGNWKMFRTAREARLLVQEIRAALGAASAEVVLAPPFTALGAVADALAGSSIGLGAQNMHWETEGAFTGEISPAMLKDAGCTHVLLGHSERRQLFAEQDDGVARKTRAALDHGLIPIVCVGETLKERESERTLEVVERQLERALRTVTPDDAARSILAYEPVWAIGTGRVATPEQAQDVHRFIRRHVSTSHGAAVAAAVRILYGGSVKPDNAKGLLAQADIDGALVGGASLDAAAFSQIVAAAQ